MTARITQVVRIALASLLALVLAACASAGASDISITSDPFSFTPNVGNTASYFTIANNGNADDTLVAASTDLFGNVELHDVITEGGVAQMVEQTDGIPIPAGSEVTLEPGGLHVMLLDAAEELEVGDEITIDLTFENAGEIQITSVVQEREEGMGGMNMDNES